VGPNIAVELSREENAIACKYVDVEGETISRDLPARKVTAVGCSDLVTRRVSLILRFSDVRDHPVGLQYLPLPSRLGASHTPALRSDAGQ
jgi:hypothetical protein